MTLCQPLLVFDGDDTLWVLEPLYDHARASAARVVQEAGLDPVAWDELQRKIDVENINNPDLGLSSRRFPTSCEQAYRQLCSKHDSQPDESVAVEVYRVSTSVFEAEAPLMPDVQKVLRLLAPNAVLVLLTKGDPFVQEKRISDSGLRQYFTEVNIVDKKTEKTFTKLGRRFGVPPERSWSIGNSLEFDIDPAVRAGWRAIWIDAHVWEYERGKTQAPTDSVIVLHQLADVPEALKTTCQSDHNVPVEKGQAYS